MRGAGWDVLWIGEQESDPGDEALLAWALRESRILITVDKDFGELAVLRERKHAGLSALTQGDHAMRACARYAGELTKGAIVTVEVARVRIRPGNAGG